MQKQNSNSGLLGADVKEMHGSSVTSAGALKHKFLCAFVCLYMWLLLVPLSLKPATLAPLGSNSAS